MSCVRDEAHTKAREVLKRMREDTVRMENVLFALQRAGDDKGRRERDAQMRANYTQMLGKIRDLTEEARPGVAFLRKSLSICV